MRSRPRGPRPGRSVRLPPLDALGGNVHESTYHQRGRPGRRRSRGHRVIGVRWDVSAVREQHHRLAADRRTGRQLAADRERSERRLPEGSPRGDGERPVPDLGQPSAEARRDAGRRERPGRDRDGQHRDDEVHGGRCLPGPDVRQGVDPELGHVARGPRRLGSLRRQALRRPVLRRLARRHVPLRPVQEGRRQGSDQPRPVHGGRARSSARATRRRASRRSTSPAPTGTSR